MFENLFKLRGELDSRQKILFGIAGLFIFFAIWAITAEFLSAPKLTRVDDRSQVTNFRYIENDTIYEEVKATNDSLGNPIPPKKPKVVEIIHADSLIGEELDTLMAMPAEQLAQYGFTIERSYSSLPQPWGIIQAIPTLINKYKLIENTGKSLWINILSYMVAILISIPLGFLLGLVPLFRGLFGQIFDSFRFIPLAAVTFIFIFWFGIGNNMKIAFLAFGIIVYLVPVVVQRIDEVKEVYLKTVFTLGASTWDTIRTVYIPSVLSRISDDIRVLTAISWTYITIAEMLNEQGGLGGMMFKFKKQSNLEYAFVLLIIIIIIGILQDYILRLIDRIFFPYKYVERGHG